MGCTQFSTLWRIPIIPTAQREEDWPATSQNISRLVSYAFASTLNVHFAHSSHQRQTAVSKVRPARGVESIAHLPILREGSSLIPRRIARVLFKVINTLKSHNESMPTDETRGTHFA